MTTNKDDDDQGLSSLQNKEGFSEGVTERADSQPKKKMPLQAIHTGRGLLIGGIAPQLHSSNDSVSSEEDSAESELIEDVTPIPLQKPPSIDSSKVPSATSRDDSSSNDLESQISAPESDYASQAPSVVLKTAPDAEVTNSRRKKGPRALLRADSRRQRCLYFMGAVSLVLLIAVIAVAIVIFGGKSEGSREVILSERQREMEDLIEQVSSPDLFLDKTTPQSRARDWLLFNDAFVVAQPNLPDGRIKQRYALAVFFFATGGANSWQPSTWLRGDECDGWEFLSCDEDNEIRALVFSK